MSKQLIKSSDRKGGSNTPRGGKPVVKKLVIKKGFKKPKILIAPIVLKIHLPGKVIRSVGSDSEKNPIKTHECVKVVKLNAEIVKEHVLDLSRFLWTLAYPHQFSWEYIK